KQPPPKSAVWVAAGVATLLAFIPIILAGPGGQDTALPRRREQWVAGRPRFITRRGRGCHNPRMLRQLRSPVDFLQRVIERLSGVGLFRTAGSLAFTTLLGLVPLFTVAFTYVSRLPLFDRSQQALESFLLRFFLPGDAAAIHGYINEFTSKASELKGVATIFV